MILRLSQKLNTKIKSGKLSDQALDENPYADWSCHLFTADRTHYIILCNTKSLYSCVMCGKGITDDTRFIERALSTIREFMEESPFAGRQPVFLGDDVTDEDGFELVRRLGGLAVAVGERESEHAQWRLPDVAAVLEWLQGYAASLGAA